MPGPTKLCLGLVKARFLLPCTATRVAGPSGLRRWFKAPVSSGAWVRIPPLPEIFIPLSTLANRLHKAQWSVEPLILCFLKNFRGHTDLNHGPIGLQPIALPLSYIPNTLSSSAQECPVETVSCYRAPWWPICLLSKYHSNISHVSICKRRWYNGQHSCLPSS